MLNIYAVLSPPITIFGSQTQAHGPNPSNVDDDPHTRPLTIGQTVNNARRRSYGKISEQDEADPNIRYKKSKSGSTRKAKVVGPRDYPDARLSGGSKAGPSQHQLLEQLQIAILCLPRTVCSHCSAPSSRDLVSPTARLMQLSSCADNEMRTLDAHDIQIDAFQRYQRAAKQHGLWFTVEVNPTQGALLPQLHRAIMAHFSSQALNLPLGDRPADDEDFGTLPWQLVRMKKRRGGDFFSVARDTSLHAVNITLQALKPLPGCRNPESEQITNWMIISLWCPFPAYHAADTLWQIPVLAISAVPSVPWVLTPDQSHLCRTTAIAALVNDSRCGRPPPSCRTSYGRW